jgi:predicted nucleotidyltransferase
VERVVFARGEILRPPNRLAALLEECTFARVAGERADRPEQLTCSIVSGMEALRRVIERDARIAYAMLFGSGARETMHVASDRDVAIGLQPGTTLGIREIGALVSDLEEAAGRPIDLVTLEDASPAVAYHVFRDGVILVERDHRALADRKARAILEYLDFRPLEEVAIRGALAPRHVVDKATAWARNQARYCRAIANRNRSSAPIM